MNFPDFPQSCITSTRNAELLRRLSRSWVAWVTEPHMWMQVSSHGKHRKVSEWFLNNFCVATTELNWTRLVATAAEGRRRAPKMNRARCSSTIEAPRVFNHELYLNRQTCRKALKFFDEVRQAVNRLHLIINISWSWWVLQLPKPCLWSVDRSSNNTFNHDEVLYACASGRILASTF